MRHRLLDARGMALQEIEEPLYLRNYKIFVLGNVQELEYSEDEAQTQNMLMSVSKGVWTIRVPPLKAPLTFGALPHISKLFTCNSSSDKPAPQSPLFLSQTFHHTRNALSAL